MGEKLLKTCRRIGCGVSLVALLLVSQGREAFSQTSQELERQSQWDFYTNIVPTHSYVKLYGDSWSILIDNKYNVRVTTDRYRDRDNIYEDLREGSVEYSASCSGSGVLLWKKDHLEIMLTLEADGSCSRNVKKYKYVEEVDGGGVALNLLGALAGVDAGASTTTTKRVSAGRDRGFGSGRNSWNSTLKVRWDEQGKTLEIPKEEVSLSISGDCYRSVRFSIGGSCSTSLGDEVSSAGGVKDQFGSWKWNNDRSKIYLEAINEKSNFILWNTDGEVSWGLELPDGAKGNSEITTENGEELSGFSMSFDGEANKVFQFAKDTQSVAPSAPQQDSLADSTAVQSLAAGQAIRPVLAGYNLYDYATYNRFKGVLDKQSAHVLQALKEKRIVMLNYAIDGKKHTAIFNLDGLETILDNLE